MTKPLNPPCRTIWTYAYEVFPAQAENRMRFVRAILEREHEERRREGRTWTGRLVQERQITNILIVSDSPQQDLDINRRLEAALAELNASFSRTLSLEVADERTLSLEVGDERSGLPTGDSP
jgi:hypothetical protein